MIEVKKITAIETYDIRLEVLRKNIPLPFEFKGDFDDDTFHLGAFKNGALNILIATDIAARGIDVSELALVVNYDLPNIPETYVHRIGRTGRAEEKGNSILFYTQKEESAKLAIEKLMKYKIIKP